MHETHVRIIFLRDNRYRALVYPDSYVAERPVGVPVNEYISHLLLHGFTVNGGDSQKRIMPGAILSITLCDAEGYSEWDRARLKEGHKYDRERNDSIR